MSFLYSGGVQLGGNAYTDFLKAVDTKGLSKEQKKKAYQKYLKDNNIVLKKDLEKPKKAEIGRAHV